MFSQIPTESEGTVPENASGDASGTPPSLPADATELLMIPPWGKSQFVEAAERPLDGGQEGGAGRDGWVIEVGQHRSLRRHGENCLAMA